jgi:hypothetical protein
MLFMYSDTSISIESKLRRGNSRYQELRWALANQGGIAGYNSRPYRGESLFFLKKSLRRKVQCLKYKLR